MERNKIIKELNFTVDFWMKLEDKENGGLFNYMDNNGVVDKDYPRYVLLLERNIYFYSATYAVTRDERCKDIAKRYFDHLKDFYMDTDGGLCYFTSSKGEVLDRTKNVYFQAFGIYALSEYYLAFQSDEALDMALSIFDYIEQNFKVENGYIEQLEGENLIADCGVIAERSMNSILHILEAYTVLLLANKNKKVANAVEELLNLMLDKIYNQKEKRLDVFFDSEYNSLADYHSYGHDIEACWLIEKACDVLCNEEITNKVYAMTAEISNNIANLAFNGKCLFNERVGDTLDKNRVWWVQAEGVLGFFKNYKRTGNEKYKQIALALYDYIENNIKSENLDWWALLDENDMPIKDDVKDPMVSEWKCPYHNGRMYIELLKEIG